jgi:hypothetical protein
MHLIQQMIQKITLGICAMMLVKYLKQNLISMDSKVAKSMTYCIKIIINVNIQDLIKFAIKDGVM